MSLLQRWHGSQVGLLCGRPECEYEYFGAHRNLIERTRFAGNGAAESHTGLQVLQRTHEIEIRDCTFEGCAVQRIGVQLGSVARESCVLEGNSFEGEMEHQVQMLASL